MNCGCVDCNEVNFPITGPTGPTGSTGPSGSNGTTILYNNISDSVNITTNTETLMDTTLDLSTLSTGDTFIVSTVFKFTTGFYNQTSAWLSVAGSINLPNSIGPFTNTITGFNNIVTFENAYTYSGGNLYLKTTMVQSGIPGQVTTGWFTITGISGVINIESRCLCSAVLGVTCEQLMVKLETIAS